MIQNQEAFLALLKEMREAFLGELEERCADFDTLILRLERASADREAFNALYRGVHSLKGAGGTHGLNIITTLCHQLENLLSEADSQQAFDSAFATRALAYVDLLRRVPPAACGDKPDYSAIEAELEVLRLSALKRRKAALIAESTVAMARLYQKALEPLPLQLSVVDNGLTALARLLHEPFDFVIVGGELKELNGLALMSALRASRARNQDIDAILVSSKAPAHPEQTRFSFTLSRDQNLAGNLLAAVRSVLANAAPARP